MALYATSARRRNPGSSGAWPGSTTSLAPVRFGAPLDPAADVLPKRWERSGAASADLLLRLCRYMLIDPARLELRYYSEQDDSMPFLSTTRDTSIPFCRT